jgi:hypothetical protein
MKLDRRERWQGVTVNTQISRTTLSTLLGMLLVLVLGWLLFPWGSEPFIVSPQPVHLTRQVVSMFAG